MNYRDKLRKAIVTNNSCLCIGLDPHIDLLPESLASDYPNRIERVIHFLTTVIEVTHPYCAAYKPNLAFFEALGTQGLAVFEQIVQAIPDDKVVIADAKRGDIGSTAAYYCHAYFEEFNVDALTLNPLLGFETLDPFMDYPEKGIYVLALTSNPGAADFLTRQYSGENTTAGFISSTLQRLQQKSATTLGMVVGATQTDMLTNVISNFDESPLLIPGIGTQGGNIEKLADVLKYHNGIPLISSSRSILFSEMPNLEWERNVIHQAKSYKERLRSITETYV